MWGEGKRRWGGKWARWHVLSNLPTTAQSYASYSSGLIIQVPSSLQFSVFSQSLQQALAASLLRKPGHRPRRYHITWVTRAQGLGLCLPARSSPTSSGNLPFVREKFWTGTGKWHLILEMGFLGGSDHYLLLSFSCWDRRRRWHPTPVLLPGKISWTEEPGALHGVVKSRTQLSNFTFTFHFHALEKEMATHSSGLAWRIPGMASVWWAAVYGVAQSRTWLKWLSSSSSIMLGCCVSRLL